MRPEEQQVGPARERLRCAAGIQEFPGVERNRALADEAEQVEILLEDPLILEVLLT